MKLLLAAPESFLPSALTALPSQASALHFFMNEVFAAPASALPSLPTALVSQDCANAVPPANVAMTAARIIRFIGPLPSKSVQNWTFEKTRSINGRDRYSVVRVVLAPA